MGGDTSKTSYWGLHSLCMHYPWDIFLSLNVYLLHSLFTFKWKLMPLFIFISYFFHITFFQKIFFYKFTFLQCSKNVFGCPQDANLSPTMHTPLKPTSLVAEYTTLFYHSYVKVVSSFHWSKVWVVNQQKKKIKAMIAVVTLFWSHVVRTLFAYIVW